MFEYLVIPMLDCLWEELTRHHCSRCFVARRNWYFFSQKFPVLSLLIPDLPACGVVTIYIEATLRTTSLLNGEQLVPFITSMLSLTLVTNVVTTCRSFCFSVSISNFDNVRV